ncbi:cupin-like domain-containing protein [Scytonema hofmannii FACHB-248]|uniref:Cupin-like domain-containing protein n=1 Tax=Scytonema hofmannii FACHB-248 TaxID=1842502 RepID=A0ABR8GIT1_9CYAN|nr:MULTISPECIES: cupin-like domain-containing protein [Nostocales]MBD2603282.1 cupin-like domain-containing protein [Scytonema hofmannii FACHB-248]
MNITAQNKFNQTSVNQIERIHKPTLDEFKQKIFSSRKPVIITGKINDWKAYSLWSVDYLNNVVGNKEINVNFSKKQIFDFDPKAQFSMVSKKMKFTDFTDWIFQEKTTDEYYYLQQSPIKISFPELIPDIEVPDYIDKKLFIVTNLWIGTGGNVSQLHYDMSENLLSQLRGRKRVLLFEPKQTSLLYPFPAHSKIPHMSQLNIDQLDIDQFPRFQKAKYMECLLEPGEMLFIPAFWWHQVYSLDQLNISINFWWKTNFKEYFTPPGRRLILQVPGLIWQTLKNFAGV